MIKRWRRNKYLKYKEAARTLAKERLEHLNRHYNLKWGRVSIKNAKTRWGSCSQKGNLNFNYRLVFLPPPLVDYLVVHELCHLQEFNHSRAFWQLVAQTIPYYLQLRRELKKTRMNSFNI